MNELPFVVCYIRWADITHICAEMSGPQLRRLYNHEIVLCLEGRGHIVSESGLRPRSFHALSRQEF